MSPAFGLGGVEMTTRSTFRLLSVLVLFTGLLLGTSHVRAQQTSTDGDKTAAAANDQPKPAATTDQSNGKGKTAEPAKAQGPEPTPSPYTYYGSIEFGVRGVAINGNGDKYRSDLNYTPGFRIFDSSLMMKSNNGNGPLFDQLMVNTFGWGTDPNRYVRVSTEKATTYKFDASYRRLDYFNSLRNLAAPLGVGQHIANTEYRQGDFDLTIFPASDKFRLNLGYSLDRNSGPSLLTYDYSPPAPSRGDEYPVLAPTRWAADDYRIGFDAKAWVFDISFLQGWRFFKDDTTYFIDTPQPGNSLVNLNTIDTFHRDQPTRGDTPYTRLSLHTLVAKRLDFTGRFIYSSTTTKFSMFEDVTGTDASNKQIVDSSFITGNAKRPTGIGDLAATLFVTDKLRISDTFRVHTFRINGGNILDEMALRTSSTPFGNVVENLFTNTLALRTTNYKRYLNTIEGDYDVNTRLSFHVGYRYTKRHIELRASDLVVGEEEEPESEKFDNETHTLILGFKAKPIKPWSVYFDLEKGGNDNVFTRTANYDYTNVRVRSIIRPSRTLTINTSLTTKDNTNPSLTENFQNFGVDINSRIFSSSVDWTPDDHLNLSGGYSYFHVTSEAMIIFFVNRVETEGLARYFMKDHFAFFTAYWEPHPRVRLYGGYRIHYDAGQQDRAPAPTLLLSSFPYQFQSPEFKLSIKLHKNVDWIAGYQYFDYKERFINNQFYQAHLPYTSLRIYFGKGE
jgi:hypothetical protein